MNDKIKMIINIVGFYIGWWGCILGSSNGLPYIGPLLMLSFIIFHGTFFVKNYKELQFIVVIGIIGTIVDSEAEQQRSQGPQELLQRLQKTCVKSEVIGHHKVRE